MHLTLLTLLAGATMSVPSNGSFPQTGLWRAHLDSPGGVLAFTLRVEREDAGWAAWIRNGVEEVRVPLTTVQEGRIALEFVHYNSEITARVTEDGSAMDGTWRRRRGPDEWTVMSFHARHAPEGIDSEPVVQGLPERWSVRFSSSEEPAVGVFESRSHPAGNVAGTFLTTTGDYRFLGGSFDGTNLTLSVFDGAHAFLFRAARTDDGTLAGDFWSRDAWHETWTARPDEHASLPDPFTLTTWSDASLADLRFRTLDGESVSPADERFQGRARIIEVFGTWCPNCNDATRYLIDLHERYGDRGLSILGLAFEVTGDHATDATQVRRYIGHHGIGYTILIAGTADKAVASAALPVLDRVRSYPTFIFMDRTGGARAIYTGFSGPATGAAHAALREDFERIIEAMLRE